ncbi:17665_t:CDS:2, partial [Rhizophagus irregularis]
LMIRFGSEYINIKPKVSSESIRILSVWFNVNDDKNVVLSQAKSEVKKLIDNIKHKRISDKQLQYIFNALIIPTIEYRTQVTILNDRKCESIMSPFRRAFRKKLRFSCTNFLIQLNDTGLLEKITMLRLKQLQHKFWIKDNIISVFPFDNNFYKKLFYSKRNYNNWILENIKILKYNNIDISVNNKLSIEKYKITGDNVTIRNILGTEKFFNNIHRIKKDGVMFLDQLIGISNSYLINWCTLKLKSFREDTRNYIKPKKWYRELQNIVTIDGKTLKPEYKISAVSHFKGYNMAQCEIDRNNIPKKLTFIGIWNNRNNNIEIGVLIIIGHLNVINNVNFRSSVIQLQKCSGYELDNIEQLSEKNYNCNI